jgi:radical SAM protein with 4Fe4S-binding SPASM domain
MTTAPRAKLDAAAFEKLRRIAPNQSEYRRTEPSEAWRARPLPEEVAFKLTNRCDLRCAHCYQWNPKGYHHKLRSGDLDLKIIEKVLIATRPVKSNVYLWGGEPLLYRHWKGMMELLEREQRWTSICTNGTFLQERMDSLFRISNRLEIVLAMDGFEAEHDGLRGDGAFGRVLAGVRTLVQAHAAGRYGGEITVNCVIQDAMIGRLQTLVKFLEAEGVHTVYLSFPWYLSEEACGRMDAHVAAHFPWLTLPPLDRNPSWYSYNFRLDASRLDALQADLLAVDTTPWRLKLRYNPELTTDEMAEFLAGSDRPAQNKKRCVVHRARMDVFPNGEVISCKFFPEFAVGDLKQAEVIDIWKGERFDRVRETVARCGLMPVCAKCNLLYTRGL